MSKAKRSNIEVQGTTISILSRLGGDYISLTDMVRNFDGAGALIEQWLKNKDTVLFLSVWERINNPDFNSLEFEGIRNEAGRNSFFLSAKKWIDLTGAKGLIASAGRYGGTYAHKDIAFEFGSWLSPEFKLYLIKEFQRLKDDENDRLQLNWNLQRTLAKINYRIHTDAIKETLIPPSVTKAQASAVYASEADLLNVALFGQTAKQWRDAHPDADLCHRIRFGVVISGNLSEVVSAERHGSRWKPFLEGDEIGPYSINYRGRFLNYDGSLLHRSRTPDVFECRKIMIQRITGGQTPLKAALDDDSFYNKESILNLILKEPHAGMYEFILAVLNSKTANWFYRKRFTNDSKLTVNLSKEYVGQIPIKKPSPGNLALFAHLVRLLMLAKRTDQAVAGQFLEDLIDACVMECYFREHMAERDLLFHDTVASHLAGYDLAASKAQQRDFLTHLHAILNAPSHPIRNRLLRLTADIPDLLAIIKQEGRV